ncbi:MAG: hypothetical protein V8S92_03280, partial [Oscillospiraceae bacterium]
AQRAISSDPTQPGIFVQSSRNPSALTFQWGESADELRVLTIRFHDQIRFVLRLSGTLCAGNIVIFEFIHTLPRLDRVPV